ncbi:Uncharacterised protein [Legionella pneumophila]|nr:Uncharacterised protein [Legionella pneumophila]
MRFADTPAENNFFSLSGSQPAAFISASLKGVAALI